VLICYYNILHQLLNINRLTTLLHCLSCKFSVTFVDAFDELTDKITQFISNVVLSIQFSVNAVNFIVKFQKIPKILPIYCRGILIWATL